MSAKHPIVAVTGSSGAGSGSVRRALEHIFRREGIEGLFLKGEGFHRYNRAEMRAIALEAQAKGARPLSHFGPEGNLLGELEKVLREYGEQGTGRRRHYIHDITGSTRHNGCPVGTFTEWEPLPKGSDIMVYEGLHGGYVGEEANIARHIDLLIGLTPIVNLEWIQKIIRDNQERGYSREAITQSILNRMHDYVHHITPQFTHTHINLQRVPLVDTSNPFIAEDVPTLDESVIVIHFRNPSQVDFRHLQNMIEDSFMSRPNTLVIPGGKIMSGLEMILQSQIHNLMEKRRSASGQ